MGILAVLLGVVGFLGVAPGGSLTLPWDSTSCHLVKPIPGSSLSSLSFLGKDAQGLALFHAHWDAFRRLQVCTRQDEPALMAAFSALCAYESTQGSFIHTPGPELQSALTSLRSQWEACRDSEHDPSGRRKKRALPSRGRLRMKRGWTMPGTLWCGVGNSAENSSELGIFRGPDLCCREHDRCPQNISPLQYNYGIRNFRFHTISHCDCDARFQECLRSQHDSISDIVGVAFFNVLEIPCFVLKEQEACVEWYWWGGCKTYGSVSLAHLQPRTYYNASWNSAATTVTPSSQSPAFSKHPQKRRPQKTRSRHPSVASGTDFQGPGATSRSDVVLRAQPRVPYPHFQSLKPQGARRACRGFRHLDQCEHQIKPQETKFHLLNSAYEPLFHCNCTRRLARFLKLRSPPAGVNRLWKLLGTTCFKLVPPLDCAEGKGCSRDLRAIKVSARHLQWRQPHLWDEAIDEGQAWPSEPPRTPVSFYSQCLQLTQAAHAPNGQQKSWSS